MISRALIYPIAALALLLQARLGETHRLATSAATIATYTCSVPAKTIIYTSTVSTSTTATMQFCAEEPVVSVTDSAGLTWRPAHMIARP